MSNMRKNCRISGEPLQELFSLGELYVSNFLPMSQPSDPLDKVELTLCIAPNSELVQLNCTADFDRMYGEQYWYRSGTNNSMVTELNDIVDSVTQKMDLLDDVWVDIGCNDGTLLSFVPNHVKKIGFDPSKNNCKEAEKHATVINDYFTSAAFKKISKKAKVVTSIAMMYDLEDPHKFIEDVNDCLDDDGVWVIQVSYLPLMLCQLAFDNICHEHLEYYSLRVLSNLLEQHDLQIVDFRVNDTNGGSCRLYVQKKPFIDFGTAPFRDVAKFRIDSALCCEEKLELTNPKTYYDFYEKINTLKKQTVDFIKDIKSKGKSVWGYGASTKGNTLLQYFGLNCDFIDAIAERQPVKYGLKTVGTHIPIKSEKEMRVANPDYMLILPWHFIDEFVKREKNYLRNGGKFIVPCPTFEVIDYL